MTFDSIDTIHTVNWTVNYNCSTRLLKNFQMSLDEFLAQIK